MKYTDNYIHTLQTFLSSDLIFRMMLFTTFELRAQRERRLRQGRHVERHVEERERRRGETLLHVPDLGLHGAQQLEGHGCLPLPQVGLAPIQFTLTGEDFISVAYIHF